MQIRIRQTGAVMYDSEYRAYQQANDGPSWNQTTEEILDSLGADMVFEGPQAQPTRYQVAFADGVEQIEGKWYTKYSVADMDAEQIAVKDAEQAQAVRSERNAKLAETDWTQLVDSPVDHAAWFEYRQALRDITAQAGFPWTIDWPERP
jgi:hypothetical protein